MEPVKIYKSNGMEVRDVMVDFSSIEPIDELKGQYKDYVTKADNRFGDIYFKKAVDSLSKIYFFNFSEKELEEMKFYLKINDRFKDIIVERFKYIEFPSKGDSSSKRSHWSCLVATGDHSYGLTEFDDFFIEVISTIRDVDVLQLRLDNIIIGYKFLNKETDEDCWTCLNCGNRE